MPLGSICHPQNKYATRGKKRPKIQSEKAQKRLKKALKRPILKILRNGQKPIWGMSLWSPG